MGDEDTETAGVEIVAESDTHVGLLDAILADGDAGVVGNVFEMASPVVEVEIIRLAIIGDEEIDMAVLIKSVQTAVKP
jgi:hypothetical protein